MKPRIGMIAGVAALAAVVAPPGAHGDATFDRAAAGLMAHVTYVEPSVEGFVREKRLAYAARVASHAADGRRIVVAFVGIPDSRLNDFRDELYARLDLQKKGGALIVATPTAVTMRTANLTPDAELAIIKLDSIKEGLTTHRFTEPLAELIYDTGLVIHNTTPGSHPRGDGIERDLRTFPGRFSDEVPAQPGVPWWPIAIAFAVPVALAVLLVGRGRRRRT